MQPNRSPVKAVETLRQPLGDSSKKCRPARPECSVQDEGRRYLSVCAANHAPSSFDDADEIKFDRSARDHVAFGFGIHEVPVTWGEPT